MDKTRLIFLHELAKTIRTSWYIVITLAVPLALLLGIEIYGFIQNSAKPMVTQTARVGYVDQVGGFDGFTEQGGVVLVRFATPDEATQALAARTVDEYIVIAPDYVTTGIVARYTLQRQIVAPADTSAAVRAFLVDNLLAGKAPPATIARVADPLTLVTTTVTDTGAIAADQGGVGPLIVPMVFAILLVFSLSFASGQMLLSLGDEKENRLMEVLLSSVSTRQLLVGKVLGLSVAGLAQVVVWAISVPFLMRLGSSTVGGFLATLSIPTDFLGIAVVYFVLGYLLFAVLTAGIGAISPSASEGQQAAAGLMLLMVAPIWFTSLLVMYPANPASVALTIFPISAPVVVMIRIGATDIPTWELAASIALLLVSIVGGLVLAARLFRTYLLMYGKRPSLGEVVRSLR